MDFSVRENTESYGLIRIGAGIVGTVTATIVIGTSNVSMRTRIISRALGDVKIYTPELEVGAYVYTVYSGGRLAGTGTITSIVVGLDSFPSEYPLPASQLATLTPPAAITGFSTSAKQDLLLTELQKKADLTETQPVSLTSTPLPTNASTSPKQDEQTALLTTLNSLIDTLYELTNRLAPLAGVIANTAQIRAVVTGSVTATGGGYITTAQHIANTLTLKMAGENLTAIHSNINNVTT